MTYEEVDVPMISDSYNIHAFMEAMENKSFLEILSLADREITTGWRRAHRESSLFGEASVDRPEHYQNTIKEFIEFLRAAVTYRPYKIDKKVFQQFLQIRRKLAS